MNQKQKNEWLAKRLGYKSDHGVWYNPDGCRCSKPDFYHDADLLAWVERTYLEGHGNLYSRFVDMLPRSSIFGFPIPIVTRADALVTLMQQLGLEQLPKQSAKLNCVAPTKRRREPIKCWEDAYWDNCVYDIEFWK